VRSSRRLIYDGDRRFRLEDATRPEPGPEECVVSVVAAGICGSDVHGYAGLNDRRPPGTVMGHEASGRVVAIGPGVEVEPGTPVALWPILACGDCDLCAAGSPHLCRERRLYGCTPELPGAFATEITVPAANLVELPAAAPAEWGALVEPLAVGHHAIGQAGLAGGERVAVIGGGAIGIGVALAARRAGAGAVTVVEPLTERRGTLAALGLDAVGPEAAPADVDLAVECVGHESTVRAALQATRPGGTAVLVGLAAVEVTLPMVPVVIEERRLIGSSAYTLDDFRAVADALGDGQVDLGPMIERRVDIEGLPATFEDYAAGREPAVKTLMITEDGDGER
jgi:2-desacetyl-2-hydroxyethyl bacteriochlorophyllide A dehydrogenase